MAFLGKLRKMVAEQVASYNAELAALDLAIASLTADLQKAKARRDALAAEQATATTELEAIKARVAADGGQYGPFVR